MAVASPFFSTLAPGRIWIALDLAFRGAGAPAGRWDRRHAGTGCRGHRQPTRDRCSRLPPPLSARCWPAGTAFAMTCSRPSAGPGIRSPWLVSACSACAPRAAVADSHFKGIRARALFAGLAAHSFLPLESPVSAAFGLVLGIDRPRCGLAHSARWSTVHRGCTRRLPPKSRGHGHHQMPPCDRCEDLGDLALLDVTPRQLLTFGGDDIPAVLPAATPALPLRSRRF